MDSNTWIMILRMSAAVAAYILLTAVAWKIWQKRKHTLGMKILIGLLYGAASVASNHIGAKGLCWLGYESSYCSYSRRHAFKG